MEGSSIKKKILLGSLAICCFLFLSSPYCLAYNSSTDYMSDMVKAVLTGDRVAGLRAEELRNTKIRNHELNYSPIAWDDLNMLSKIIYSEAGAEWLCSDWKMSTGEVVLNRVASPEFPNSISEVVYQKGQYAGTNTQRFEMLLPDADCVDMARRLLEGERVLNNSSVVFQSNFKQGSKVYKSFYDEHLGWTYFCISDHPELY